jgi:hypothetical protein
MSMIGARWGLKFEKENIYTKKEVWKNLFVNLSKK